jgi:hypothetical protein
MTKTFLDMVNEVFGFKPKPKRKKFVRGEPILNQNGAVVGHHMIEVGEEE